MGIGDKMKNAAESAKGKIKERTGDATDNEDLQAEKPYLPDEFDESSKPAHKPSPVQMSSRHSSRSPGGRASRCSHRGRTKA